MTILQWSGVLRTDTAGQTQAVKPAEFERIRTQQPKDKNKLYALHAPEVECIGKGKARQPYEFGVKASVAVTHKRGLVVGARTPTTRTSNCCTGASTDR